LGVEWRPTARRPPRCAVALEFPLEFELEFAIALHPRARRSTLARMAAFTRSFPPRWRARVQRVFEDGARGRGRARAPGGATARRETRVDARLCAKEAVKTTSREAIERAVRALRREKVIALPTDTIYGFACDARSPAGVAALYAMKSRDFAKPIAIAVGEVKDIETYGDVDDVPRGLLEAILPGPVTVLARRRRGAFGASEALNPGVDLIGIRVPNCDFVRAVCRAHGGAIALTSANRSGEVSTTAVEEFAPLWADCEEVFDGGRIEGSRLGSTIVDLSARGGLYGIVREGERCVDLMRILEDEFNLRRAS